MIPQENISHLKGLEIKLKGLDLNSTKRSRIIEGFISAIRFKDTNEKNKFIKLLKYQEDISKIDTI